jgi:hypothetical protein
MTEEMSEYLGRDGVRERKMMARCGNKERENRYWVEGEEKRWMKEIWKRGERTEKETGGA